MNREAKELLKKELKAKGLSTQQITWLFTDWNEEVEELILENKEEKDGRVR